MNSPLAAVLENLAVFGPPTQQSAEDYKAMIERSKVPFNPNICQQLCPDYAPKKGDKVRRTVTTTISKTAWNNALEELGI